MKWEMSKRKPAKRTKLRMAKKHYRTTTKTAITFYNGRHHGLFHVDGYLFL